VERAFTSDPNVMHGTPCFAGTRVTIQTFFDHLEAGYTISGFLEQFPTVKREQVIGLLAAMRESAIIDPTPFPGEDMFFEIFREEMEKSRALEDGTES